MCGINGIWAYHYAANPIDRAELVRTRDHMAARGPDGSGCWIDDTGRAGLGHRRLAIIDLSDNGHQPMATADGRYVISFNGEIYNHAELRAGLAARGHRFASQSDTEVLLHLYAERGAGMVRELRGMFAFAIWDNLEQVMLLARDPYGIKPLYYSDDGWTCRFASQVKALLAGGAVSRDPDPAGQVGFYLFGSVPEPFTMYRSIRTVPAGATIRIDRTGAGVRQSYHAVAAAYASASPSGSRRGGDPQAAKSALLESVRAHLVADVPVGAFLSAGIDSGALVGLMRDAGAQKVQTVTIGFEEFGGSREDETPLAAEVAKLYATRHTTRIVTRSEFETDLPKIFEAMDQPSIDGVNTWFVAKAARELGLKVAISGLGGDELLGGYPSFQDIPRWVRMLRIPGSVPFAGAVVRRLLAPMTRHLGLNPKAAGMLELGGGYAGAYLLKRGLFMPWELGEVLDQDTIKIGLRRLDPLRLIGSVLSPRPATGFGCVASLEASLYMRNQLLRDTDWASMAHSLEVRVPLVDSVLQQRLATEVGALGEGAGKRLLASAPSVPLPDAIVNRRKTGFTTPVERWSRTSNREISDTSGIGRNRPWTRYWSLGVATQATGA